MTNNNNNKCLFPIRSCHRRRFRHLPYCYQHYQELSQQIGQDTLLELEQFLYLDNSKPTLDQFGGNIVSSIGKIASLVNRHSGKVTDLTGKLSRGLTKTNNAIGHANKMMRQSNSISNQAEQITSQISSITGSYGNYGQNELTTSRPLGNQGVFQSFGDFICIRKSFLADLRTLLFELLAKRDEV